MFINWVYLFVAFMIFVVGLNTLRQKKGGLYIWKPPFGYTVGYYTGKAAIASGFTLSLFGFFFTLDALRSLVFGNLSELLVYTFCGGFIILLAAINIFARRYMHAE